MEGDVSRFEGSDIGAFGEFELSGPWTDIDTDVVMPSKTRASVECREVSEESWILSCERQLLIFHMSQWA